MAIERRHYTAQEYIAAEKCLLAEVQDYHASRLTSLGIVQKALEVIADDEYEQMGRSRTIFPDKVSVAWVPLSHPETSRTRTPAIRITTVAMADNARKAESGAEVQLQESHRYAEVMDLHEEVKHPFSEDDLTIVIDMLIGLAEAREDGILPNLESDGATIRDYHQSIAKA